MATVSTLRLRATSISTVIANAAELLSPAGTFVDHASALPRGSRAASDGDTFRHSRDTEHDLAFFISHSWRDSARLKHLALLWKSNLWIALVASNAFAALWALLTVTGYLPVAVLRYSNGLVNVLGWSCVPYTFAFYVSIFWGHHANIRLGLDVDVFLDKACVPQDDPDAKAAGIGKLGSVIVRSRRALVLWGPDYFTRLWTNYELACFLTDHGAEAIYILPLIQPVIILVSMFGYCFSLTFFVALIQAGFADQLDGNNFLIALIVGFLPGGIGIGAFHATSILDRREMMRQLEAFDAAEAHCFCCDAGHPPPAPGMQPMRCDRAFVHGEVGKRYADGLAGFTAHVRSEIPRQVRRHLGAAVFPMAPLPFVLCFGPFFWFGVDVALNSFDTHVRWANALEFTLGIAVVLTASSANGMLLLALAHVFNPTSVAARACMRLVGAAVHSCLYIYIWFSWDAIIQDPSLPAGVFVGIIVGMLVFNALLQLCSSSTLRGRIVEAVKRCVGAASSCKRVRGQRT